MVLFARYRSPWRLPVFFTALLLLKAAVVPAQEEPHILIRSVPDRPVAGSTWILTLLIAHSEPNEVDVRAPHFSDAIFLEHVLKGPRLRNPVTGQTFTSYSHGAAAVHAGDDHAEHEITFERWTAMEYRFALHNAGTVAFDSFTVITPHGQTKTAPFRLQILRPSSNTETRRYQLAWEAAPTGLKTGESAIISLRISGWNAQDSSDAILPEAALFLPPVPQGIIIESLPISTDEQILGTALKLRIIPLETAPFILDRRQISHNGAFFEIPALRIAVTRPEEMPPDDDGPAEPAAAAASSPPLLFPSAETAAAANPRLYQKYRAEFDEVYIAAKNLWNRGRRAGALAALRKNERDHGAGALFAVIRRGAEQSLGFAGTNDEKKRGILPPVRNSFRSAVLRETAIRRIPDAAGEIIGRFREGQPALISPPAGSAGNGSVRGGSWLQVIANDSGGTSGWIPEESVIYY